MAVTVVTVDDEYGTVNVSVRRDVADARRVLLEATLLGIDGKRAPPSPCTTTPT